MYNFTALVNANLLGALVLHFRGFEVYEVMESEDGEILIEYFDGATTHTIPLDPNEESFEVIEL